jgi:hypothetical protein
MTTASSPAAAIAPRTREFRGDGIAVGEQPRVTCSLAVGEDPVVGEIAAVLIAEGVLLESARGPIPNVAELITGAPIRGSWWAHPQSHRIFATINALAESPDVARMRLVDRRITLVHRRLWAPLLRLEARFPPGALLVVVEEHTPTGAHRVTEVPLSSWVDADVPHAAAGLDEPAALATLPGVLRDRLA